MTNAELVLWSYSIGRAWRSLRSQANRITFAEWSLDLAVEWNTRKWRKIQRLLKKAKA